MKRIILGSFEVVDMPEFDGSDQIAKVDSGAYSGAVHATNIRVVGRGGKKYLRFNPFGNKEITYETDEYIKTFVRSATGHQVTRYLVNTTIVIQGTTYKILTGVSDRSFMKKPILLGRRFMRENAMLVDVSLNDEYDDEGETSL